MLRKIGPADREPTPTPPQKRRTTKRETPAATQRLTRDNPGAMNQDPEAIRIDNRVTSTIPAVKVAQVQRSVAIFSGAKDKGSSTNATAGAIVDIVDVAAASSHRRRRRSPWWQTVKRWDGSSRRATAVSSVAPGTATSPRRGMRGSRRHSLGRAICVMAIRSRHRLDTIIATVSSSARADNHA